MLHHRTLFRGICFRRSRRQEIQQRQHRQMRDHGLHAQAAVEIRLQQCMDPADVLTAAFRAIASGPKSDDGDQASFLIGNHDQAAGKPVYVLQGTGEGSGNGGLDAVGFLGFGDKFNAESCHRGKSGSSIRSEVLVGLVVM
jgi:hypothetical protein